MSTGLYKIRIMDQLYVAHPAERGSCKGCAAEFQKGDGLLCDNLPLCSSGALAARVINSVTGVVFKEAA